MENSAVPNGISAQVYGGRTESVDASKRNRPYSMTDIQGADVLNATSAIAWL